MAPLDETLFISTTPGLEPALDRELRSFGFSNARVEPGGATLSGSSGLHRELNLRLRTASRVLLRVGDVKPTVEGLRALSLGPFIPKGAAVTVSGSSQKSHVRADRAEALAREAWRFQKPARVSSEDDEEDESFRVQLRLEGELCTVSIDTSGELLHRRGYRQEVSHAPLRETLASGMLLLAGYDGSAPLWDPMCGSGTIVIEAALIAEQRAPGLERTFAFEKFPSFDEQARGEFEELKSLLRSKETKPSFKIRGTDIHAGALGAARRNGKRAGVQDLLALERRDVATLQGADGFIVTNPPYGKRVGDRQDLGQLYADIGQAIRKQKAIRFGLLVADEGLEKRLELPVREVHRIQNGGIWCRFLVGASD